MLQELTLLKLLTESRQKYLQYNKYLKGLSFEIEIKSLLEAVSQYYDEYPEEEGIKFDDFVLYFSINYPTLKDRKLVKVLLSKLEKLTLKEELIDKHMTNLIERYYAAKIVGDLTPVLDGTETGLLPDVAQELEAFEEAASSIVKKKEEFVDQTLDKLLKEEVLGEGLKWRLNCLNNDIGELRGGSLGHIFARVDTGKTTLLVSETTNFAKQLKDDEIIVWFNNEEKGSKVQLRIYSGLLGLSKRDLIAPPAEEVEKSFEKAGGKKIKLYDNAVIDIADIEKVLKSYNVRLMVIDQGDKIKFRGEGKYATHERLKIVYGKFRELAKQYNCDIITVGQADFSAENKKWLNLTNMDNSKTGKPGELDYAIGVGAVFSGVENVRFIHMCKNKMKDGNHGRHEVFMDAAIARYTD